MCLNSVILKTDFQSNVKSRYVEKIAFMIVNDSGHTY